jgi:hypothetical protein
MVYFKIATYSPILSTSSCPHERKQEQEQEQECSWRHEPVPCSTILLKGEPQRTFQTQR